ncbi:MAG: hypothetical protein HPY57_16150 [Ignavibacteria bacterium]|nr:hypothetical protein [Ignavibacteria bacterium]
MKNIKNWKSFNENIYSHRPIMDTYEGFGEDVESFEDWSSKYNSILSELKSLNLISEQIYNLVDEYFFDYKAKDEKDPKSEIDVDKTLKKMAKYFTNREDEYERFMKFFGK